MSEKPLLEVVDLVKEFRSRRFFSLKEAPPVRAVEGVSFSLHKGRTLSVVGESGSGKSTLARMVMKLIEPTSGQVLLNGESWLDKSDRREKAMRKTVQFVFQDPFSSINPRMRIRDVIAEPLINFGICSRSEIDDRVRRLLGSVDMPHEAMGRYPHEFSGGQRQRIVIARALASEPDLVVCDEAVSALDVSVQAQILNLLNDIQRTSGVSYLFISHDLAVVQYISDEVAVMHHGRFVEFSEATELFSNPRHEYTIKLLNSVPGSSGRAR
ncbi:MAG: ATP-binding cassette domain-containing protein [Burkholderiaceae bacterium]